MVDSISRRSFLKTGGAMAALAPHAMQAALKPKNTQTQAEKLKSLRTDDRLVRRLTMDNGSVHNVRVRGYTSDRGHTFEIEPTILSGNHFIRETNYPTVQIVEKPQLAAKPGAEAITQIPLSRIVAIESLPGTEHLEQGPHRSMHDEQYPALDTLLAAA